MYFKRDFAAEKSSYKLKIPQYIGFVNFVYTKYRKTLIHKKSKNDKKLLINLKLD